MTVIYIIIGCALASLIIKIIKAIDKPNNNTNQNNNSSFTVKDGINLYFGKVAGKIIILIIALVIILLLPLIASFLVK